MRMKMLKQKLKKPRRKRTKNNYFTKVHEEAIVKYALSSCRKEKTDLYGNLIQPAFDEMVNKIIFTYKFKMLKVEKEKEYKNFVQSIL